MRSDCEHVFGNPPGHLGVGERLCNEPIVKGARYTRIYHLRFEIMDGGNARCLHCNERFLED